MYALLWFMREVFLRDLQGDGRDECGLFAVVQRQFAGADVDQLQLPGQQRQAVMQGIQCLVMQLHGAGGVGDQALYMPGKLADCLQGQAVCSPQIYAVVARLGGT